MKDVVKSASQFRNPKRRLTVRSGRGRGRDEHKFPEKR
jgi:hypothetical protein